MFIPGQIIDNSDNNKLVDFLKNAIKAQPNTNLDIATAFFNVQAYSMVKEELSGIKKFRLLLGKAPEIDTDTTLGDTLLTMVKEELEGMDLSEEKVGAVTSLIQFLKKDNVEVRIYEKEFLHGKAYIFDKLVVVGSSNFTASGLTHNTELNSVALESEAKYTREQWFEKFWGEARDFKSGLIQILEESRFGSIEYLPYMIYMKALYELQKQDIEAEDEKAKAGLIPSKVELTEFQDDAVHRIYSRLKKYGSILIADSVGLGKTWIAKKIIEDFGFFKRKRFLIVCPAQLRGMWKNEIKDLILTESILSQEELATEDFLDKAADTVGGHLEEVELIVVDESHNLRNPLSNRYENFFTLVHDHVAVNGNRPYILFLTATPINNTIWDLYWQIKLLVLMEETAFVRENIPNLFKFFKEVERRGDPTLLNDLLNEISIRRTRDYIKKNYPDATIYGKKIIFPDRVLDNITYKLDSAYKGMYGRISDAITEELTMAYYRLLKYKKKEKLTVEEELVLGRMIALEGIFRTILLKRLESSVEAFRLTVSKHIRFLQNLKENLKKGKLLTKQAFNKYLMSMDEEIEEDFIETLEDIKLEEFKEEELFGDVDKDIRILKRLFDDVAKITPDEDAKLKVLKERILDLSKEGQLVIFTYYADTLDYIYDQLKKDKRFATLRITEISGRTAPREREKIVDDFINKKIDVLMSTDVLSEGMNLQSAKIVINYDLHWNPTRMIQRAGRIDRIGSPYKEIYVYNFFPEDELEQLLRLVQILQEKIIDIDRSVGLDQTILGEAIHPKVFGIIRRIREKDATLFDELEQDVFGGGERFYQPLKDFLRQRAIDELAKIPLGVYSGLKKGRLRGIFFYYKYGEDFHFWYLYDLGTGKLIKTKTEIIDHIACTPEEPRLIPDFFNQIYEINRIILEDIEKSYKEIEQKQAVDSPITELSKDQSSKFVAKIIQAAEHHLTDYLSEFPEDREIESRWESIRNKLVQVPLTRRRLTELRRIWKRYNSDSNWKRMIDQLGEFVVEKGIRVQEKVEPFDSNKLKLVVIDLLS